jgi:hypothetical protein
MCASKIPTRLEIEMDSKTEERVLHLDLKLKELSKDLVKHNRQLSAAQAVSTEAAKEASNTKIFLESCEVKINDLKSEAGLQAVMMEMRDLNLEKLEGLKETAQLREKDL